MSLRLAALVAIALLPLGTSSLALAQTKAAPAAAAVVASAPNVRPGLWETSAVISTPGSTSKRTIVSRACLTAADLKQASAIVPLQHEAPMKCDNRDIHQQGAEVAWRVSCAGQGASLAGAAKMTLAADSFEGHANLESKTGGKSAKVEETLTGKWISECK